MKGRKYSEIDGFGQTINRFQGKKHKNIVRKVLQQNSQVKKNNYISAYDPATKQFVSGSLKEVAEGLSVSQATIQKRLKVGSKMEMKDVKGFIIGKHKDVDNLLKYREAIKKEDKIIIKEKAVVDGVEHLDLLQPNYDLRLKETAENKTFGTNESRFNIDLSQALTIDDIATIFDESIKSTTQGLNPADKVRIVIIDPNLQHPISTSIISVGDISAGDIMNVVETAIESNEEFVLGEDTEIIITTITPPKSYYDKLKKKKNRKKKYQGNKEVFQEDVCKPCKEDYNPHKIDTNMKKSVVKINNTDDLCVPRAIATGYFAVTEGLDSKNYDNAKRGRKIQKEKAEELVERYNMLAEEPYQGGGFSVEDLEIFEDLTGCQITAIDGDNMLNIAYPEIESGGSYKPPQDSSKCIYLYLSTKDGLPHCDLINNNRVAGFFGKHYFCHMCKNCYSKKDLHSCLFKCKMCCKGDCPTISQDKSDIVYNIECSDCFRFFPNETCYNNHKGKVCNEIWKCQDCKKVMKRELFPPETHICGDYLCENCKNVVHEDHQCYMFPHKVKDTSEKYVFFDFEADISGATHEVMYSVSMKFDSEEPIIHNDIDEFCEWAFSKENKGYTFIAHNGKGYDYRFIIKWIYENTIYKPFVIWGGEKIITMSVQELSVRFVDSLCFLTMPLSAMPKTFGLKNIKKGFFPHWFNTKENWDYEGPMPPLEVFKPERMSVSGYEEFMKWYQEQVANNYVWNQKAEMKAYCISDVDILRKCCITFRELYIDISNIDPFTYTTIAGVCMSIYKNEFIDTTFAKRTAQIEHLKKKCGDPSKLKGDMLLVWNTMMKTYKQETLDKVFSEKKIAIFNYEDVEWMRQAFFGGRTNAVKLIYNFRKETDEEGNVTMDEEGIYSDITSLYPTVNYYDIYPKGHPIIITEEEIDEEDYIRVNKKEILGFIDCEVECPKDLYHPVLPLKGEKLIFDLNDKRGVWCSNEVYVALDMGYKIKKIYEIRHFREGTSELFKGYVAKFLKIKQEASDYPAWVSAPDEINIPNPNIYFKEIQDYLKITEEERQDLYINQYEEHQGILLDKRKIKFNPGLRAIAKLCLNSLWGKFGQRTNMGRCEIISDNSEFFDILYNEQYENIQWETIGDKIQISYQFKDEYVKNDYNTNMAIACFTTSRARMRLYEEALHPLNKQVLYFDTDSVVYKYDKHNPKDLILKNGDLLGDWTNELENNEKIVGTFLSGGPKNYSYELECKDKDGKTKTKYKTKVKGFTLNKETSEKINHLKIKELIEDTLFTRDTEGNKIVADWHGIKRAGGNTLENTSMEKRYGLCYTKRQILEADEYGNHDTLPFGWGAGNDKEVIQL